MYELVRQIWGEERIPEEWKETIIIPVHKREERERGVRIKVEQYWEMQLPKFCRIQYWEKLNNKLEKLWGTIRMNLKMEDL